jgi:hypothetical protein
MFGNIHLMPDYTNLEQNNNNGLKQTQKYRLLLLLLHEFGHHTRMTALR